MAKSNAILPHIMDSHYRSVVTSTFFFGSLYGEGSVFRDKSTFFGQKFDIFSSGLVKKCFINRTIT